MLSFFLALRNVLRNRERSLLTLIGVLLAIGSFVGLVSLAEGLSYRASHEVDSRDVDIYVVPHKSLALPSGPIGTLGFSQDTVAATLVGQVGELGNVQRVDGVNRDSWSGRKAILPILYLDCASIRAYFPRLQGLPDDLLEGQVLLGQGLAAQELEGRTSGKLQHGQSSYEVVGVLRGGGFQDFFAFVKPAASSDGYQEVWVQLRDKANALGTAREIQEMLPSEMVALTRQQYLQRTNSYVQYAWLVQASVASIGILIAITASMNTMLMSTYERMREFAVLRAIGASRLTVSLMLLWESLMLSCAGGVLGCLFGLLTSGILDQAVIVLLQLPFPLARVTPLLLLQGMLLSALVGLVGAVIPLILVWRQKIMDGLRSE